MIALLLFASATLRLSADRVVEDATTTTLIYRKIAVPAVMFNRLYAIQQAQEFLTQHDRFKAIRLTLVPDEEPATYTRFGCDHCEPYKFWMDQWDHLNAVSFPIAEMISIEGNAVLRYRDQQRKVTVTRLRGSDPRPVRVGRFTGRIVHIGMSGRIEAPIPQFYVVGKGEISSRDGAAFARELTQRLSVKQAWVDFRADSWFINEIWTPFFPWFDAIGLPPTQKAFNATKTPYCFYFKATNNQCDWKGLVRLP